MVSRDRFANITQRGTVTDYIMAFDKAALEFHDLGTSEMISTFVRGFKPAVKEHSCYVAQTVSYWQTSW